ncbi:hypothetical protein SAMN05216312_103167 [Cohnella sp. OV330]|uniref:hypothetical protein n=1 Tax=Cohnella sp. OV330 TaxID=1855288 RepID=UPI0008EA8E56|nr:hypothetical protein [Cohnella sp. OV330]SFB04439.1 hypothetical protein SAMN05216312_103167 [Cohnella sp. OV330]
MKLRRNLLAAAFALVVAILISYSYYNQHYSEKAILAHVTSRDGYRLDMIQEQVPIEVFIKPEWIAFQPDERKDLEISLVQAHHTTILLDDVWHRGKFANDIYFSSHAVFNLKFKSGEFLYNGVFHENGSFSSPSPGEITIYDINKNKIPVGQLGFGPGADFSFGISLEDQKRIENGFYVKYTGYMLYHYSKT